MVDNETLIKIMEIFSPINSEEINNYLEHGKNFGYESAELIQIAKDYRDEKFEDWEEITELNKFLYKKFLDYVSEKMSESIGNTLSNLYGSSDYLDIIEHDLGYSYFFTKDGREILETSLSEASRDDLLTFLSDSKAFTFLLENDFIDSEGKLVNSSKK